MLLHKKNHTRIKEKQGEILLFSVSPESKNLQLPKAYLPPKYQILKEIRLISPSPPFFNHIFCPINLIIQISFLQFSSLSQLEEMNHKTGITTTLWMGQKPKP
jgi:hypothetical protein